MKKINPSFLVIVLLLLTGCATKNLNSSVETKVETASVEVQEKADVQPATVAENTTVDEQPPATEEAPVIMRSFFDILNSDEDSTGYITTEETELVTRFLDVTIDEGIYVPDYFEALLEVACDEIENACGLKFCEGPLAEGKIPVHVQKPSTETYKLAFSKTTHATDHNGNAYSDSQIKKMIKGYYAKSDDALYVCYNTVDICVYISACDILPGDCNATLVHEICHALYYQYELPRWELFSEGFAEETTDNVLCQLEKKGFNASYKVGLSNQEKSDLFLFSPELLKKESLSYYFTNTPSHTIAINGNHSLGYNFMEYLDTIGGYTKWIESYAHSDYSPQEMVNILSDVYGISIEEGFYNWLDNLEKTQEEIMRKGIVVTGTSKITLYPYSNTQGMVTSFPVFDCAMSCKDLTINLLEAKKYLVEFKNENPEDLFLDIPALSSKAVITLYDENNQYVRDVKEAEHISLDGIGYVRIVNASDMYQIAIRGYDTSDIYTMQAEFDLGEESPQVIEEDKMFPLEGEGQKFLRKTLSNLDDQYKKLAELGYYKAGDFTYDGKKGCAFLIPEEHMKYIEAASNLSEKYKDPWSKYRLAFSRSGYDVEEYPPTRMWTAADGVYIAFTPTE